MAAFPEKQGIPHMGVSCIRMYPPKGGMLKFAYAGLVSITACTRKRLLHPLYPKDPEMLKAYSRAVARMNSLRTEEEGATATEYALIIGVASIAIVGALALLAPAITDFVNEVVIPALGVPAG